MTKVINIYCDESCHLPADGQPVMVLGAVWCTLEKTREVSTRLREIREKHNLPSGFEIKWSKVSPAKTAYYLEIIDYFFDDDDLKFRGVVAHKSELNHGLFNQSHDDWYYKMMFLLLSRLLSPGSSYRIYLDKKDSRSGQKVRKLHQVLSNDIYDFDRKIVERVQIVESHDVIQMQLSDLLLGAISYVNRDLSSSASKMELVERIRSRSGYSLKKSTLYREEKFNLFHWQGTAT
jgi:hypothetical protein